MGRAGSGCLAQRSGRAHVPAVSAASTPGLPGGGGGDWAPRRRGSRMGSAAQAGEEARQELPYTRESLNPFVWILERGDIREPESALPARGVFEAPEWELNLAAPATLACARASRGSRSTLRDPDCPLVFCLRLHLLGCPGPSQQWQQEKQAQLQCQPRQFGNPRSSQRNKSKTQDSASQTMF